MQTKNLPHVINKIPPWTNFDLSKTCATEEWKQKRHLTKLNKRNYKSTTIIHLYYPVIPKYIFPTLQGMDTCMQQHSK